MTFRVLYPYKDAALWQSYVDRLPIDRRDVLLTPAYARVQGALGRGLSPICLVWEWQDIFVMQPTMLRDIGGCCVHYDLASFYGGGGPICNSLVTDAEWLDKEAWQWRRSSGVICEYAQLMLSNHVAQRIMLQEWKPTLVKNAVVVDINKNDAALLASFSRNRQRGIKDQSKHETWVENNAALFANLYTEIMRQKGRHARWMFSRDYWEAYVDEMSDEHCAILNVGDRSMLMIVYGYGKCYAHFIAGETSHDLLYFEAMKHARDAGCTQFYLGGGTTNAADDPLLQYKLGFSKRTVGVYAYRRVFDDDAYVAACRSIEIEPVLIKDEGGKWRVDTWHHGFFPGYRTKEAA